MTIRATVKFFLDMASSFVVNDYKALPARLHTFSKYVTHYDTFVPTGRKAVMWALRGGEGASPPLSADSPLVFRAMTLPFFPSVVPTPESHRDVAPRWRARSCEVLAHFPREGGIPLGRSFCFLCPMKKPITPQLTPPESSDVSCYVIGLILFVKCDFYPTDVCL